MHVRATQECDLRGIQGFARSDTNGVTLFCVRKNSKKITPSENKSVKLRGPGQSPGLSQTVNVLALSEHLDRVVVA